MSVRAIARQLGLARVTVARVVAAAGPPRYERPPRSSAFDGFEPDVRRLLAATPSMPATVLAQRVGWSGSPSWFRKRVALIRPEYAPRDPADRIVYRAGDQAQCDLWFPPVQIPLGHGQVGSPPVLVVVASFSRYVTAVMIPSRTTPDLLAGMWVLLAGQIGAVPRRLIWDNEAGIGRRGVLADGVAGFCGVLATRIVQLKPFDPESKGIVERANKFLETSFLPGRAFTSPEDFNIQLAGWLPVANARHVRRIAGVPNVLIAEDRAAMVALPPVAPPVGFTTRVRLARDYYVRVLGNDYSVDPLAIGRIVDIQTDLEMVRVHVDGRLVAAHARAWCTGATITDPAHARAAAVLRERFQAPRPEPAPDVIGALERDLADYDHAFNVELTGEREVA